MYENYKRALELIEIAKVRNSKKLDLSYLKLEELPEEVFSLLKLII